MRQLIRDAKAICRDPLGDEFVEVFSMDDYPRLSGMVALTYGRNKTKVVGLGLWSPHEHGKPDTNYDPDDQAKQPFLWRNRIWTLPTKRARSLKSWSCVWPKTAQSGRWGGFSCSAWCTTLPS